MSASDSESLFSNALIGTLSLTTMSSQIFDYVGPTLMKTFGLDVNYLTTLAVLGFAIYAGSTYLKDTIRALLYRYYTCTINIKSQDPIFQAVMTFLEEEGAFKHTTIQAKSATLVKGVNLGQKMKVKETNIVPGAHGNPFLRSSRHLEATFNSWSSTRQFLDEDSGSDSSEDSEGDEYIPATRNRRKVRYSPASSCEDYFYYKPTGHTVTILREDAPNSRPSWWSIRPNETLRLTIYGKDPTPLKLLLSEVVERQNSKDYGRTAVYKARQGQDGGGTNGEWVRCISKPVRSLDTVILDQEQKDIITEDLKEFLLPVTSKWYSNRGLPYRRGYLLYGPPGTGKTSLSVALAGKFDLPLYSLSLSVAWMNDDTLTMLFSTLPKHCIVLLEDIDACGVTRAQDGQGESKDKDDTSSSKTSNNNGNSNPAGPRVSFSGLLNAIDGVASKEGRILIMTTNHRERLDEALIRPGRVDVQIKYTYADKKIIHGLFLAIYEVSAVDRVILKFPKDFPDKDEIARLANEFAERIPKGVFSPAEVQGLLLMYKKDPEKAVAETVAWVEQAMVDKKEKQRKEKEKEEKERKERERQERRDRRKKEKEEKEKREKRERGEIDSDDDTEDEEVTVVANGKVKGEAKVNGVVVNGEEAKVNGVAEEAKVNGVVVNVEKMNGIKAVSIIEITENEVTNGV